MYALSVTEMSDEKIKSCRICLHIIQDEIFHIIGKSTRDKLDLLLIKLDVSVEEEPLMCSNCAEILEKCHTFKAGCLDIEDKIEHYVEDGSKIDIRRVYLSENGSEDVVEVAGDQKICRLCLKIFSNADFVFLTETDKETTLVKDIIQKYIPELDLNKTEDPTVCESCQKCLQCYCILINNCLCTENGMNQFCTVGGSDDQQFMERKPDVENAVNTLVKHEECLVKTEPEDSGTNLPEDGSDTYDTGMSDLFLKNEEIKMETANGDDESSDWCQPQIGDQAESSEKITKPQSAKGRKRSQNSTLSSSTKLFKYVTSRKSKLKSHGLVHKSLSEVKSYKCNMCTYQTKYKAWLKPHLLLHRNPSELEMYKCRLCPFETKYKHYISKHMDRHKNPSEFTMFQCELCQFTTRHRWSLKRHIISHKNSDKWKLSCKVKSCNVCTYKTKYKKCLERHILLHKNSSQLTGTTMYKCKECPFETKYKPSLKTHIIGHKNPSEVTMYQCELCQFKTRYKKYLNTHMMCHKNPDDWTMYRCEVCDFKTRYKSYLHKHMVVHKSPSEIVMFKCNVCSFESKYKHNLKSHVLSHRSVIEISPYKCDLCTYQTKDEANIKSHMVSHQAAVYKCDL